MDALQFLQRPRLHRLFVVHGDEDFLHRLVIKAIRHLVLGAEEGGTDDSFSYSVQPGETATFASVMDELHTVPMFGDRRLIVVDKADSFVSNNRALLEKAVAKLPATAVLVLDVKSWPSTTRLAKIVDAAATISCKAPAAYTLPQWCVQWAAACHQKQLSTPAARLLVDLVGPEMGLLDQEVLKLAIYVGDRQRIDVEDVDKLVGRSHSQDVWKVFEAIAANQAKQALTILGQLFEQGEEPIRLLGAFSKELRRLAQASRLTALGRPPAVALEEVGIPSFALKKGEQQLKHLGRRRTDRLYDWLLEADQGAKGASQLTPRTLLERLVLRLATATP